MTKQPDSLVLDTHIWLWFVGGEDNRLEKTELVLIDRYARQGLVYLAPISIWEIGVLVSKGKIFLQKDPLIWIQEALKSSNTRLAALSPEIAIESTRLPGDFHKDPADRMIAATARSLGAMLLTRDEKLLTYGKQGYVQLLGH